jgi:hypothetical protein
MALIDKLREESFSGHVAFTEFVLKLKSRTDCIFCFFEGKDDHKYYGIRIESIAKSDFETINCGGKDKLLELRSILSSKNEYKDVPKCYFIDKDYGESGGDDEIYCLPTYSIENQYARRKVFHKILEKEFQINKSDLDFEKIDKIFQKLQKEFHEKTLFINSWLACQSDYRKEAGLKTYLRIDSTIGHFFHSLVDQDFKLSFDHEPLNSLESIQMLFSTAPVMDEVKIKRKVLYFKKKNPEVYFRGKFQLYFFTSFLERLKSELGKKSPRYVKQKYKCSLRFEYATSLTTLSIYAETPTCLFEYLKRIKTNAA